MAFTKKLTKESLILFLFLALLPFGQILRVQATLFGNKFYLNASDLVAISSLVLSFLVKLEHPSFWKHVKDFSIVVGFSLLFSLAFFEPSSITLGLFYFVRLVSYFYLFLILWNFFRREKDFKDTVFQGLILSSGFIAAFGWLQYLLYPDLRALFHLNWDDHLLRMVGGFLDPTFTGILLVFGVILSTFKYLKNKKRDTLVFILFLLVSIAFTYSRASYLALWVSFVAIGVSTKKLKKLLILGAVFTLIISLLPRAEGEGVNLARVNSVYAKTQNYRESLRLVKASPLFGIGYNNSCLAKRVFLGNIETDSHACSGLDSSILFLLATGGITSVFSFINLAFVLYRSLKKNIYGRAFLICGLSLIVHSLFANSLFYSWAMGFMGVLLALAV